MSLTPPTQPMDLECEEDLEQDSSDVVLARAPAFAGKSAFTSEDYRRAAAEAMDEASSSDEEEVVLPPVPDLHWFFSHYDTPSALRVKIARSYASSVSITCGPPPSSKRRKASE